MNSRYLVLPIIVTFLGIDVAGASGSFGASDDGEDARHALSLPLDHRSMAQELKKSLEHSEAPFFSETESSQLRPLKKRRIDEPSSSVMVKNPLANLTSQTKAILHIVANMLDTESMARLSVANRLFYKELSSHKILSIIRLLNKVVAQMDKIEKEYDIEDNPIYDLRLLFKINPVLRILRSEEQLYVQARLMESHYSVSKENQADNALFLIQTYKDLATFGFRDSQVVDRLGYLDGITFEDDENSELQWRSYLEDCASEGDDYARRILARSTLGQLLDFNDEEVSYFGFSKEEARQYVTEQLSQKNIPMIEEMLALVDDEYRRCVELDVSGPIIWEALLWYFKAAPWKRLDNDKIYILIWIFFDSPFEITPFTDQEARKIYFEEQRDNGNPVIQACWNYAARNERLGFTSATGRQYLEDRAAHKDQDAQENLNEAAAQKRLGFTPVTGRQYLEARVGLGDQDAQKKLNRAAANEQLGFNSETGRQYLEVRVGLGDQDAQEKLNEAAAGKVRLGFIHKTGHEYLMKRLLKGDPTASKHFEPYNSYEVIIASINEILNRYKR